MNTKIETIKRDAVIVEDAATIRVMGFPVLEALPSRSVPYEQVDPFILPSKCSSRYSLSPCAYSALFLSLIRLRRLQ